MTNITKVKKQLFWNSIEMNMSKVTIKILQGSV